MIKSLGHVGLSVSDMDRSLAFYRDQMGMEVVMDLDISDDRIAKVIGVPGAKCRIVHLALGGNILELFQYAQPVGENRAHQMQQYDHGLTHIGFEVNDFHHHIAQLKDHGIEFLGDPLEFRPDVWIAYFRGPEGEVCEIRQC